MSELVCKECGSHFETQRGLHKHIRTHVDCLAEYYVKHFPRFDKFSKEPIPFKKYDQYFQQDFVKFENYLNWVRVAPIEETKKYILSQFKEKIQRKLFAETPPNLFYKIYEMPDISVLRSLWGSYKNFIQDAGINVGLSSKLPDDFWGNCVDGDMKIFIDTREQLPIVFPNSISMKLDFGDYTAAGKHFCNTFVDRKSDGDFRGTFGAGVDRFRREMDRCVEFNAYMFVVVETGFEQFVQDSSKKKYSGNLSFIWHNVTDLMSEYPNNLQFIFAHSRAGAKIIIPKILQYGSRLWNVDLQYWIDERIRNACK